MSSIKRTSRKTKFDASNGDFTSRSMPEQNSEASFATCFVDVLDANDDPIQGVSVFVHQSQGLTNLEGKTTISVLAAPYNIRVTAFHPCYVRENAQFSGSIFSGSYDNALVQRSLGPQAGDVNLILRLGRFASAPTRILSDEDFLAQAKKKQDIGGVVIEPLQGRPGEMSYRNTLMYPEHVKCANMTLTPSPEADTKAMGWGKLNHETVPVDSPENYGRLFYILSQKSAASPQPLILYIWSPNLTSEQPVKEFDIIFFYHPSTGEYTAKYPFGVGIPPEQSIPAQAYPALGSNYMQNHGGPALIYPLIARQRKAIIVFPVSNQGTWGPFLAQEGVWRMCKEVSFFLHRECRTSSMYTSSLSTDKYKARAGASLRDISLNGVRATDFGQPPRIRKIVIGFFSEGCRPAKSVLDYYSLSSAPLPEAPKTSKKASNKGASSSFPANLWGCPHLDAEDFKPIFLELWDMDGFHPDTGGWSAYLGQLDKWYHSGVDRSFHLCHSDGRGPRRPLATLAPGAKKDQDPDDKTGLWKKLIPDPYNTDNIPYRSVDPKKYTAKPIEEVHGRRWSITALRNSYLEYRTPGMDLPDEFPVLVTGQKDAAHPATLRVGWSHNIVLSDVSKYMR